MPAATEAAGAIAVAVKLHFFASVNRSSGGVTFKRVGGASGVLLLALLAAQTVVSASVSFDFQDSVVPAGSEHGNTLTDARTTQLVGGQAPSTEDVGNGHTETVASGHDTECHTVFTARGRYARCSRAIDWAIRTGLLKNPEKFRGFTRWSRREEFQALFHGDPTDQNECPRPCPRTSTTTTTTATTTTTTRTTTSSTPPFGTPPCPLRPPEPQRPSGVLDYNGISWPAYCFVGLEDEHVLLIGDWGGLVTRKGLTHPADNTKDKSFRTFFHGIDDNAQRLVASQFNARARQVNPRYVLNVGDNFYWGGIDDRCGRDFGSFSNTHQWEKIFEEMYHGPGIDDKPWLGCLGNHDFGGFKFENAWDQQIAYTWGPGGRWVLPGLYWHQRVDYPTKNFSVDYYFVDSNVNDAKHPYQDPVHNICSKRFNENKGCSPFGPKDPWDCTRWFESLWETQLEWLDTMLNRSTADWQIAVTHFGPDWRGPAWKKLVDKHGLDLIISGHRHSQELHLESSAGIPYVCTGGGGGVTSERNPFGWGGDDQYGFMDMTISKNKIFIEAFNQKGDLRRTLTVHPRDGWRSIRTSQRKGRGGRRGRFRTSVNTTEERDFVTESAPQVKSPSCDGMGEMAIEEDTCEYVFQGAQVFGGVVLSVDHVTDFLLEDNATEVVELAISRLAGLAEPRDVLASIVSPRREKDLVLEMSRRLLDADDASADITSPVALNFTIELPKQVLVAPIEEMLRSTGLLRVNAALRSALHDCALDVYSAEVSEFTVFSRSLATGKTLRSDGWRWPWWKFSVLAAAVLLWATGGWLLLCGRPRSKTRGASTSIPGRQRGSASRRRHGSGATSPAPDPGSDDDALTPLVVAASRHEEHTLPPPSTVTPLLPPAMAFFTPVSTVVSAIPSGLPARTMPQLSSPPTVALQLPQLLPSQRSSTPSVPMQVHHLPQYPVAPPWQPQGQ
eukprot:TRINITY_DN2673_c1_g1_i1.p1 TRINITY_DN2673_c1_g1~~TRINITY_DN2673_c1_g1_i1.p1  ORF type:complete len:975 (+),score=160.16 TRINITY_DN2673_c1_g1_i1:61-2925(+)